MKEKIYSIILTNGKIINIKANYVEWREEERILHFINDSSIVAKINMNNVVGWINADYMELIDE